MLDFLGRLWAMLSLGKATDHVASQTRVRATQRDDEARLERLGDQTGAISRAQAYAAELEGRL